MTKQLFASLLVLSVVAVASQAKAGFVLAPEPAADGTARGYYYIKTGEFAISVGANVNIVGIEAPSLVRPGQTPKLNAKTPDQYDTSVLAYFDFSNPLPVGIWSQGLVFEPNLPVDGVGDDATIAGIGFGYQSGGTDFTAPVDIVGIPEPATMSLIGLSLIGATFIRRR